MRLNERGVADLVALLKSGEVSPCDVAADLIAAVEANEPRIHAYIDFHADRLLADAERITKTGAYKQTPLAGIPVAVKDNIVEKGKRATCASRMLADFVSPYDAAVIQRLRRDGALLAGRTNLDEFGMGSSTENSAFGPTRNPYDTGRVPGGSSGGSAAAVASRTAIAALGTDTGGSIRQPAGFCGVVGMRPTYGRVSRYGLVAFASSLDQIGPITKSVRDAAIVLRSICGKDARDATSLDAEAPDFEDAVDTGRAGLTIGVPKDLLKDGVSREVRENLDWILAVLDGAKIPVTDVSLPSCRHAVACYTILADAEAGSNLARYDGVKYGHRARHCGDLYAMYTRSRGEGFGDEVKRRILLGTYVLSGGYYGAYYAKAQRVRALVAADFDSAFERCDLVLLPTSPFPAFLLGEKAADPLAMYLCDVFTIPASLAGLPAISIPSGMSPEGLPLGVQLIGRRMDDALVLRGAAALERLAGFQGRPRV